MEKCLCVSDRPYKIRTQMFGFFMPVTCTQQKHTLWCRASSQKPTHSQKKRKGSHPSSLTSPPLSPSCVASKPKPQNSSSDQKHLPHLRTRQFTPPSIRPPVHPSVHPSIIPSSSSSSSIHPLISLNRLNNGIIHDTAQQNIKS